MSQQTVKLNECTQQMSELKEELTDNATSLERSLRSMFWYAIAIIVGLMCSGFSFYYVQQEKKINKIAVASIKADERLERRISATEDRQRNIESRIATLSAKMDANMKWLIESCSRIESKQARIEDKLNK